MNAPLTTPALGMQHARVVSFPGALAPDQLNRSVWRSFLQRLCYPQLRFYFNVCVAGHAPACQHVVRVRL